MHINGTWDIRVSAELLSFFQTIRKKGSYYWKLSNEECLQLIKILCTSYNVPCLPNFSTTNTAELRARRYCGLYCWLPCPNIYTFPRPHFKTVAHEVYHHIDFYYRYGLRRRTYDSSDAKKYAWNFAERLWNACVGAMSKPVAVTRAPTAPTAAPTAAPKKYSTYAEIFDDIETLKVAFTARGAQRVGAFL